jgi:hypothetical protein
MRRRGLRRRVDVLERALGVTEEVVEELVDSLEPGAHAM